MSSTNITASLSHLVKSTVNALLDHFQTHGPLPWRIPAEGKLAQETEVSRSTIRSALDYLRAQSLIEGSGRQTVLSKKPLKKYYFRLQSSVLSKTESFEQYFLNKISKSELRPGQCFSERELAIEASVHTVQVREVLARFERLGIIEKKPRHQWHMVVFDGQMIDELFDMRELLEQRGIDIVSAQEIASTQRHYFKQLLNEHKVLYKQSTRHVQDFWDLDNRFHRVFLGATGNRYMMEMFSSISLLIHFQLQHNATGQYGMGCGLEQHIAVLEALLGKKPRDACELLMTHIQTARHVMKVASGVEENFLEL